MRAGYDSIPGGDAGGATPVPIPNTEVKPSWADGTAWATAWESRSLPGLIFGGAMLLHTSARVDHRPGRFCVRRSRPFTVPVLAVCAVAFAYGTVLAQEGRAFPLRVIPELPAQTAQAAEPATPPVVRLPSLDVSGTRLPSTPLPASSVPAA